MAKCVLCGRHGLSLKLDEHGICYDCLSDEYQRLSKLITPEIDNVEKLNELIKTKEQKTTSLDADIANKKNALRELNDQLDEVNSKLLYANDAYEMETFGLYLPRFDFAKSDEYKDRLTKCREAQKQLIRDKSAVIYQEGWTMNGSKIDGKKFITDTAKIFLRAFNNECDTIVKEVRFSNYDKSRERIIKSFDDINVLGKSTGMSLSYQYRQLKLDELTLAYEWHTKKEEEKEEIRALREQQREEAKLQKEIEAARKEGEKEKKHYLQALNKLDELLVICKNEEERSAIIEKRNEINESLENLNHKLEDIDYRQANQRAGYVYIISNIGSFGENIYKIGMTRRLDPMERVDELGDASVPFRFDVHALIFSNDAPKLEAALHQAFDDRRVNLVNSRREYFNVTLDEIKEVVIQNHDKTVEFVDVPDAEQFRESLRMKGY